mgnify:CR=1 FL=1
MSWMAILKNDAWRMVQAHMAEDKIMRPKRKEQHPLQQKRKQLLEKLRARLGEEPDDPEDLPDNHPDKASYDPNSEYSKYRKKWRESPEMEEYWALGRKIDFEYRHAVGFFQGQEPEDTNFKWDEEFYRNKGYEPPKNKRNLKRD